jgi:hypothetical protein
MFFMGGNSSLLIQNARNIEVLNPALSLVQTNFLWFNISLDELLRRISGSKRDGVTGDWRKLHNVELHNLYSSTSIIRMIKSRRIRWARHVALLEKKRTAYRILVGKPEGKRLPRKPRRMWVDNIKLDLIQIILGSMEWTDLAQDRDQWRALVNTVMNLRVPQNAGKSFSSRTIGGFSRRAHLHRVNRFKVSST